MLTNIFPIQIGFDEFNIYRLNYQDGLLDKLRKKYNKDYSFFRSGDFIYISSDTDKVLGIGEKLARLNVRENEKIVSSLIKHIFFRSFKRHPQLSNIIPEDFYPFSFISRRQEHNVIAHLLPQDLINTLGYKRQVEIQFRLLSIKDIPTHCAVINIYHKWSFKKNCFDLLEEGFDLTGLDVVHSVPIANLENVIAPDETLVGNVVSIVDGNDGINIGVSTNEGLMNYNAKELFLEKNKFNIENYLTFRLGQDITDKIYETIKNSKSVLLSAKNQHNEINSTANALSKIRYLNQDGFAYSISNSSKIPDNQLSIHDPTFIFDDEDTQRHKNPYFGIGSYGPADKSYFTPKNLNVLVVCHSSNRSSFTNFIANLEKGLPNSKYFVNGLKGKYYLHSIKFNVEEISDYSSASYKEKIDKYLQTHDKPELAIVETRVDFKERDVEFNPYYQVKAHLLSLGIPVQFVDSKTLYNHRINDSFYNIISLQMYAKLGGTPWVLPSRRNYDKEIVIGIGSYTERSNKYQNNSLTRVVGITTVFSGEGRYLLGSKCSEVNYEDYFDELLRRLRATIEDLSQEYNWREGSTILISFHIFKPIKNVEAEVVEKLISEYSQFNIKYAFVVISENHPFLLFDPSQVEDRRNSKGEFVPAKGTTLALNDLSCLLQAKSIEDIKTVKQGFPKPLLIKIIPSKNNDINFKDLNHITQQVYHFLNLSFRGFQTSRLPVTILYSDWIAMNLSNLKKIGDWKPQIINTELKRKKWFL